MTYGGYNTINSDSVWTYDVMGVTPILTEATRIGADLNGASVDGGSSPSGMALSPDGTRAYVTGFSGDSLITVALSDGRVLSRVPTGAYPYGVVASSDGRDVYVSN